MKTNNKPFMESYRNMFKVGDIVWWSEWERLENYEYTSKIQYGAIIKFVLQANLYSERFVWVAVILPFGEKDTKTINLNVLRKETI